MAGTDLEQPSLTPPKRVGRILALGVDPGSVCACLLEEVSGQHRLVGWLGGPWPADTPIADALGAICRRLGDQLHSKLWDSETSSPLRRSADPIRWPPLDHVAIAASPLLPLRVWLVGLTEDVSVAAARHALAACPVDIVGTATLATDLAVDKLVGELAELRPQILIMVGGYDVENATVQAAMGRLVTAVLATIEGLPADRQPELLFAGNRWVGEQLRALPKSAVAANILPRPGQVRQEGIIAAVHDRYWALCRRVPQFSHVLEWATDAVGTTTLETNFARLVRSWQEVRGLAELHGVYDALDRRVHVWVRGDDAAVCVRYLQPQEPAPTGWPAVGLVSSAGRTPMPSPGVERWHDPLGLAPVIAAAGYSAPLAMLQALEQDVFEQRSR